MHLAAKYEFDASFQSKIAALVVRDPDFNKRSDGLIKAEYFENDAEAILVHMVMDYYQEYKRTPDMTILIKLIKDAVAGKSLRADMVDPIKTKIREVLKTDIADKDYVLDEVATFAKHQAVMAALAESADAISKRDFDAIRKKMMTALDVGVVSSFVSYDYFAKIDERTKKRKDITSGLIKPSGITTGVPELDKYLKQKGWGKKELSLLMGAAKRGKSMALYDFGQAAAIAGHNVLIVTLENAAEIVADRLDSNLAKVPTMTIGDHVNEVAEKIKAIAARSASIKIEEAPANQFKPSDLRRLLQKYHALGIKFDLIVVDYLDIMAPERFTDNSIENSKSIYVDVRRIAHEEDAAVLSATQTNRDGAKSTTAKDTDVAEDYNRIRIADVVLSINATEEERAMGEARLYFAACRNQAGGFTLRIKQDNERAKFIVKVLAVE